MDIEKYEEKRNFSTVKINGGFSMIELLVVLVIIAILFGLGMVNFRDYARKQTVSAAARQVESDIRLAQQMSFEGKKPMGCGDTDFLYGYKFLVNADNTYDIIAMCNYDMDIIVKDDVALTSGGLTLENPGDIIIFKSVGEGIVIPGAVPGATDIAVKITQDATGYNAILYIGTHVKITPSY